MRLHLITRTLGWGAAATFAFAGVAQATDLSVPLPGASAYKVCLFGGAAGEQAVNVYTCRDSGQVIYAGRLTLSTGESGVHPNEGDTVVVDNEPEMCDGSNGVSIALASNGGSGEATVSATLTGVTSPDGTVQRTVTTGPQVMDGSAPRGAVACDLPFPVPAVPAPPKGGSGDEAGGQDPQAEPAQQSSEGTQQQPGQSQPAAPAAKPEEPNAVAPFGFRARFGHQSLASVLRHGLRFGLHCSQSCSARSTLTAAGRVAGRAQGTGQVVLRVRGATLRRALSHRGHARFSVRVVVVSASGERRELTRSMVLR